VSVDYETEQEYVRVDDGDGESHVASALTNVRLRGSMLALSLCVLAGRTEAAQSTFATA
jgi:hypothetical protein